MNEKFFELKRDIHVRTGIVEKAQETSSDSDMHNTVCLCHWPIAVLHEQWMCLGIQRNTYITGNKFDPYIYPSLFILWMAVTCSFFSSGV